MNAKRAAAHPFERTCSSPSALIIFRTVLFAQHFVGSLADGGSIQTIELQQVPCRAVCAVLSEKLPTPVRRVGVQDKFGCSGPAWDLLREYGLDAATICKTAHEMLGK